MLSGIALSLTDRFFHPPVRGTCGAGGGRGVLKRRWTKRMILHFNEPSSSAVFPARKFSAHSILCIKKKQGNSGARGHLHAQPFVRTINKIFLGHDTFTDVIAFPPDEDGNVEAEIYINLDAARNQAKKYNVTYTQETKAAADSWRTSLFGI